MNQSASTTKVTPYELATLASKICPGLCVENPKEAIAVVNRLLSAARRRLWEDEQNEREVEEAYKYEAETRIDWASGVRSITHEQRLERALKRFTKFIREENPDGVELITCKREGFTIEHAQWLEHLYGGWKEKPKSKKKGRQGRRISERDGRLRIGAMKLASPKTSKAA
jgi:hypothetical protein